MENANESLLEAVRSILAFTKRTAERDENGRFWVTIDYGNQPHRDISIFNGVAGVSFFLVDSFAHTKDPESLALAQGAIDWCAKYPRRHYERGLYLGKTGVALAALHKANVLGEATTPALCLSNAATIAAQPCGPMTDLLGGEASNGLYLLKLWARTHDAAHLAGAERCAVWIEQNINRDARGAHCAVDPGGTTGFPPEPYLGAAHGISGIAHFLALLAEATNKDRWAALSRELFDTVARHAKPAHGGLNWSFSITFEGPPRCQWSHGAPGIGLTYLTAWRVFREPRYLELAVQAAEATYGYGDLRSNYTFCTGLAGGGGLLLDTYAATGDVRWKTRAHEFAQKCIAYRESTAGGDAWPTDAKRLHSVDFAYGSAGVGHFFLRLMSDGKLPLPVM